MPSAGRFETLNLDRRRTTEMPLPASHADPHERIPPYPGGGGAAGSASTYSTEGVAGNGRAFFVFMPEFNQQEHDMAKRSRVSRNNRRDEIDVLDHKMESIFLDEKAVEIRRKGRNTKPRYQRNFVARTAVQADYKVACETSMIAMGIGPAGTGKSHVAVDTACEMFERGDVDMIVLSRPAVEAGGERLGFLPGGMREKLDPYMRPLYDILAKRLGRGEVDKLVTSGQIELCPLAFMRGRTFENAVIVLDEMQNATAKQLKLALTRLGDNSKCFVTGDPDQTDDLPNGAISGLVPVAEALKNEPGIDVVYFSDADVVRSKIVGTVLSRI